MVLEPINSCASMEQPTCRETGRGPGELQACALDGASRVLGVQAFNQGPGVSYLAV